MGNPIRPDMFDVNFEKARADMNGPYPMINREFARRIAETPYRFLNREDDMGLEGLRRAKVRQCATEEWRLQKNQFSCHQHLE